MWLPTSARRLLITPDGTRVLFNGQRGATKRRYYVRLLDGIEIRELGGIVPDAYGQLGSMWNSPAGDSIIFNDGSAREYRRLPIDGGLPTTITKTGLPGGGVRGLSVGTDGTIVFAGEANPGLMMVANHSEAAVQLTNPADGRFHEEPEFIPGQRAVLFTESVAGLVGGQIHLVDIDSGQLIPVIEGLNPRVTASGHLLFERNRAVWAVPFDQARREVYGDPVQVLEAVTTTARRQVYDVSPDRHARLPGTARSRAGRPGPTARLGIFRRN